MPTISVNIAAGADDGQENVFNGAFSGTSYAGTVFRAGKKLQLNGLDKVQWVGALRFQSVNIPQGSTVSSATLTLKKALTVGTPAIQIYGGAQNNAAAWGVGNRVLTLPKTTNKTSLDTTNATSSNNVTAIIQEIVNRAGWVANNAAAFGLFSTGAYPGTANHSKFWRGYAFEKGAGFIPNLSITYASAATTQDAIWFGSTF